MNTYPEQGDDMMRCTECILPDNYAGISFNSAGVCSYCAAYKSRQYLGGEALKEAIQSFQPASGEKDGAYDCILALSGGRDSSYLLYYLVKTLNLKVAAYCVDNGFMPEQTRLNLQEMVDLLEVDLVVEPQPHLKRCIPHHLRAWMGRPSAAMVGMLCTGCRYDIDAGLLRFARRSRIPVIVLGASPLEGGWYKKNLLKLDPHSTQASSFVLGYLRQVLRNPRLAMDPGCLAIQFQEYLIHFRKKRASPEVRVIRPFNTYIRWVEAEIVATIENELHWKKHSGSTSTWRADCDIALLKLYLYKKLLGFNDKDDGLSCLIRDGQLSRAEALSRIEAEGNIPEPVIREILDRSGLPFPLATTDP